MTDPSYNDLTPIFDYFFVQNDQEITENKFVTIKQIAFTKKSERETTSQLEAINHLGAREASFRDWGAFWAFLQVA
jgi:hypothetical protein